MEMSKEKEPIPAATETSSTKKLLHLNDNTCREVCQAIFKKADSSVTLMLEIYGRMSKSEQRAFVLGEVYRTVLDVSCELEDLIMEDMEDEKQW